MKNHITLLRILLITSTHVAALALGTFALAQSAEPLEFQPESKRAETTQSPASIAYTFEGTVLAPDGKPSEGAVVVTSAGGQAITDSNGAFQLEAVVSLGAESVQLTAAGRTDVNLLVSRRVSLSATATNIPLGPLHLEQAGSCSPSWLPTFGEAPATDDMVQALTVFDDGSGPALYVGGSFEIAGGTPASRIAKWDGTSWSALGSGVSSSVQALAVFDDGNGDALYVGGAFSTAGGVAAGKIAKWDGSTWAPVGTGFGTFTTVNAFTIFDDGSGDALYVGGAFLVAGFVSANNIAKWDGANWTPLGLGVGFIARTLTVFDDGNGDALYVGGRFTTAGGAAANHVAKWDGTTWSALGSGMGSGFFDTSVDALAVFDDGGGEALYAAGDFTIAGGGAANFIAKWDGSSWSALDVGTNSLIDSLAVFDDGSGPALFAGGVFSSVGGFSTNKIAKWDGSSWAPTVFGLGGIGDSVNAMAVFDDGGGAELYAGGLFFNAMGMGGSAVFAENIASWDGTSWAGIGTGVNDDVTALAVFDDAGGPALYVGGSFDVVGGMEASDIAKWDGTNWTTLGSGMDQAVFALAVFDDGTGEALYAGGNFNTSGGVTTNGIAKWDGTVWSALGSGMFINGVNALAVFDDGGGDALYAGGNFSASGGVTTNNIAKWDGSSWSALAGGTNSQVKALKVFDDGGGKALFIAGGFSTVNGMAAARIAKWDGSSWSPLGSGANLFGQTIFRALEVFDDGGGDALYAGGDFTNADGTPANKVAKWNGTNWSALGLGIDTPFGVNALQTFDDGTGDSLYAAGFFTTAGGGAANYIAKWNGSSWSPLGSGLNFTSHALEVFNDGGGNALFVGGQFQSAFESGDSYVAKWGCPGSPAPVMSGDVQSLSLSAGGTQMFTLDGGPSRAGCFYWVLGSLSGTSPGIPFGSGVILPLNFDRFFRLSWLRPNLPFFSGFRGNLDASGRAQASVTLFAGTDPSLAGITANHAFVTGEVAGVPDIASNPVPVNLVP